MKNKRSLESLIENGTIPELRELAKEKGCSLQGLKRRPEIQEKLRKFCIPEKSYPTVVQTKIFVGEPARGDTADGSGPRLACLPLSADEFLFMWEGGFICHPAVMSEMARETGVELEVRAYHASHELAWDIVAQLPGKVRLHLSDTPDKLTVDWATSFGSLVRIEVESLEFKDELIRRIQQTHQRFDAELVIQVGSFLSDQPSEVQHDPTWSVLESIGFRRTKRIDSMIGAIAVSSYVERLMLVKGKLNSSITVLGWLGSAIFETDIWKVRLEKESGSGNVEGLKCFAADAKDSMNLESEWQFDIRDELSAWRNGEDDFPVLWSRFASGLSQKVGEAIATDMRRGLIRDVMLEYSRCLTPWMIYVLLLWKHKGIRNRSSNASQSLLHTVVEFVDEGIVSGQDAVVIAAYHGWHLGYQLCMASPVDWVAVYGGQSHWWSLRLPPKALKAISSTLIEKGEFPSERPSPDIVHLTGGLTLVLDIRGVARIEDTYVAELRRISKTKSSGWDGFHTLLLWMPNALKSLKDRQQEVNSSLNENEIDELLREVASELESDDAGGSKRRLIKMLLDGWNSSS
jgi:hypothetical protein